MKQLNAALRVAFLLAATFTLIFSSQAGSGDRRVTTAQQKPHAIYIVDQNGRPAVSGVPSGTGQIFDVAVGVDGFTFTPPTANISIGDTVRWTWFSNGHSVTSGDPCTVNGQFCSPDDTNCDTGTLSNNGFVYEHTFAQAGTFNYFCFAHCALGMTGVVNVSAPTPTPTPTATPHSHSHSNRNSNTDSNSFRNAIGHTTAYTNGNSDSFTDTRWKASSDAAVAPNTTSAPHAVTGKVNYYSQ